MIGCAVTNVAQEAPAHSSTSSSGTTRLPQTSARFSRAVIGQRGRQRTPEGTPMERIRMQTNSGNIKAGRAQQCGHLGSQRGFHPHQQLA